MEKEIKVFLTYQKNENGIQKGEGKEFLLFRDLRKLVLQYLFLKKGNIRYINLILASFPLQCFKFFVVGGGRVGSYPTLKLIVFLIL